MSVDRQICPKSVSDMYEYVCLHACLYPDMHKGMHMCFYVNKYRHTCMSQYISMNIWCRLLILLVQSCSKLVISVTEHLVEVVDKLSTTAVVFFRS